MKTNLLTIEPLEARIAPAMATLTIVNPLTATYTDVDGDHVTVKVSTGTLTAGLFTGIAGASGDQLQLLDLSNMGFANANVTFSVVKAGNGDGLAAVGRINGLGHGLGKVTVKGDLGDIDSGPLASLTARSMGRYDIATQGASPSLESDIQGTLGSLTLTNDLAGVHLKVSATINSISIGGSIKGGIDGGADFGQISSGGTIGKVKIGGDLRGSALSNNSGSIQSGGGITSITVGGSIIGSEADGSGAVVANDSIGSIKVAHDVLGGPGAQSGVIRSGGTIVSAMIGGSLIGGTPDGSGATAGQSGWLSGDDGLGTVTIAHDVKGGGGLDAGEVATGDGIKSLTIGGSLIGGSAASAGSIITFAGASGTVKIGHNVLGGTAVDTGELTFTGDVKTLSIGGSVLGGAKDRTGYIVSTGAFGTVTVGHDLHGGSIFTTGSFSDSGSIKGDHIGSVTIGGSVLAGENNGNSNTHLFQNASIQAVHDIGSIIVRGSVVGTEGSGAGLQVTKVLITAQGLAVPTATSDLAIGKISIGGEVEFAQILAGYSPNQAPADAKAQIGAVNVTGDWIASDLVAGGKDVNADGFGNIDDTRIVAGSTISKIASITIGGIVEGTPNNVDDHFGIEAPVIGSLKIGGFAIVPTAVPTSLSPLTGDDATVRLI